MKRTETELWPDPETSAARLRQKRAHLIGIGGAGMSGLAQLLHGLGVEVSGSDLEDSPHLQRLRELGISVAAPGLGESFGLRRPVRSGGGRADETLVVRSAAVPDTHAEWRAALDSGTDCKLYAEALGALSFDLRTVAVAGTHGKTSTTALTVAGLRAGGVDPSFLVGGHVPELGGNGFAGRSPFFVVESCEFNRSFHALRPYVAMLLNLEADHFDCYRNFDELVGSFAEFAGNVPAGGSVLVHESVPEEALARVRPGVRVHRVHDREGAHESEQAVWTRDLAFAGGRASFVPVLFGRELPRITLRVLGRFQATNALFALAAAAICGADADDAARGIARFEGVARRLEKIDTARGPLLFDYAHHPSEIRAVLETVRDAYPERQVVIAFQPHQHSRTRMLLDDFAEALAGADRCLLADIYAAREDPSGEHGVSSEVLAQQIRARGAHAEAVGSVQQLGERLRREIADSWRKCGGERAALPLVLGAGELDGVVEALVRDV